MIKKRWGVFLFFSLIVLLLLGFIFSGFFGGLIVKITGQVIGAEIETFSSSYNDEETRFCEDDDGNLSLKESLYVRSFTRRINLVKDEIIFKGRDYCINETTLLERYCNNNGMWNKTVVECENDCSVGVCNVEVEEDEIVVNIPIVFKEDDEVVIPPIDEVVGVTPVVETFVKSFTTRGNAFCEDDDGNLSLEESLYVRSWVSRSKVGSESPFFLKRDYCVNRSYLLERYCEDDGTWNKTVVECGGGCLAGACVVEVEEVDEIYDEVIPVVCVSCEEKPFGIFRMNLENNLIPYGFDELGLQIRTVVRMVDDYSTGNRLYDRMDAYRNAGFVISPSIRINVGECSVAPSDLSGVLGDFGYSESYYNYIKDVVEEHKDEVEVFIIENEHGGQESWCDSMENYMKILKTAKKAIKDVNESLKVANGGFMTWLVADAVAWDMLERGEDDKALDFYRGFFGPETTASSTKRGLATTSELRAYLSSRIEGSDKTNFRILEDQGIYDVVDVVNFHYYRRAKYLSPIVSYFKDKAPGKPIMTNEIGVINLNLHNFSEEEVRRDAAREMVKVSTYGLALDVKPLIWFSPSSEDKYKSSFIDSNNLLVNDTINVFKTFVGFLNSKVEYYENLSEGNLEVHSFVISGEEVVVSVLWSNEEVSVLKKNNDCVYSNVLGEIIQGNITVSSEPIYAVCSLEDSPLFGVEVFEEEAGDEEISSGLVNFLKSIFGF